MVGEILVNNRGVDIDIGFIIALITSVVSVIVIIYLATQGIGDVMPTCNVGRFLLLRIHRLVCSLLRIRW